MHSMEPPTTPPVGDAAAVGGAAWTPAADCAPGALGYLRSTHALHIRVPTFFSSWFFENEVRGSVCSQATQGVVISLGALLWSSQRVDFAENCVGRSQIVAMIRPRRARRSGTTLLKIEIRAPIASIQTPPRAQSTVCFGSSTN